MYQPLLIKDPSLDLEGFFLNENFNPNIPLLKSNIGRKFLNTLEASLLLDLPNGKGHGEFINNNINFEEDESNKMIPETPTKTNNYLLFERACKSFFLPYVYISSERDNFKRQNYGSNRIN